MRKIIIFSIIVTLFSFVLVNHSLAATNCYCDDGSTASFAGDCPAGCYPINAPSAPGTVSLTNPLGENRTDIPTFLGIIIKYSMGIIGSLALVMFIFGGATWMLSGGNQERVAKGKQIIIWAALGIALIFTAYALVKFIIETLGKIS